MGEAAKAGDHIPVPASEVGGARIAESLKQRQRRLLHRQLFRVHQRHQPELPPRPLLFQLQPAQLPYGEADLVAGGFTRTGIGSGKGVRYSLKNWGARWQADGPGTGWWMQISR